MDLHTTRDRPKQACAAARELVKRTPRSRFAPRAKNLLAGCPKRP
jgi:outer membrane protein assembly factor BamD (BamD/ComL family)